MDSQTETATSSKSGSSGTGLKKEISGRQLLIGLLAIGAAGLAFWQGPGLWEAWERKSITRHENPPSDWKGIRLGITRREAAQILVDNDVTWISVPPPGAQITEWATQINVTINGSSTKSMSFSFSDALRWDYGGHPVSSPEVVDVDRLIGSFDPDAGLTGLLWSVNKSAYDLANLTVPLEVLKVVGEPHSEHEDITGAGRSYLWQWPDVELVYSTADGNLVYRRPSSRNAAAAAMRANATGASTAPPLQIDQRER